MTPEQATFLAEQYTMLIEREHPATCKVLAAVNDDARGYKPDPKSRTAWELAVHLATADVWFLDSVIKGAFEWDAEGAKKAESQFGSIAEVAAFYERTLPAKLREIRALAGDHLARPVSFFGMFTWPCATFVGFANNHSVHHRGQLAAYLRAMGSKVPAIYGDSADEPMQAAATTSGA
jgi:uncharacterized damage-inducible protein DinB